MAEQTTQERIRELIFVSITPEDLHNPWSENPGILAAQLAGEIEGLRAEIARLKPAAEAWDVLQAAYQGHGSSLEYAYSKACVERAEIIRAAKERR